MKQRLLIGVGGLCAVLITVVGVVLFTHIRSSNPIPENMRSQVHFATYYPASLPEGFVIDPSSYDITNSIITYVIKTPDNGSISVSQQQTLSTFDFTEFQENTLKNKRTATLKNGVDIYLGRLETNHMASIHDGQTWVLLSANAQKIPLDTLENISKTLTE